MSKHCTGDYRELDIRKINRAGKLALGCVSSWSWSRNSQTLGNINMQAGVGKVTLNYRQRQHGGEWEDVSYKVGLAFTPCHLGGQRVWWECPVEGCHKRVAVLYGGADVFACRHCYRLAYRSQVETPHNRAFRRADNLRDRLGWGAGIANPTGDKPKGMHWRTYWRLLARYQNQSNQVMAGSMAAIKRAGYG
jgi:hypothetical protein